MIPAMAVPERDEATLVRAAAGGDASAFEALVAAWQGRAWRIAMRMLGHPADAQDAVQEAFVSAWRALDRFRQGQSFGPWLVTIVTHRCLNMLRTRKRSRVDPVEEDRVADPKAGPEAVVERRERVRMLEEAMRHLAPNSLAIVVLHYAEDMPCARIGETLGMSEAAVKVALFRARARLRDILRNVSE
jgi:RNA polymerase sigma-70 factor (ECF subfamily)